MSTDYFDAVVFLL